MILEVKQDFPPDILEQTVERAYEEFLDGVEREAVSTLNAAGSGAFLTGVVAPTALNVGVLNVNFRSAIEPVAQSIAVRAAAENGSLSKDEIDQIVQETLESAAKANETTVAQVLGATGVELEKNDDLPISAKFTIALLLIRSLIGKRRQQSSLVSSFVTTSVWNYAAMKAAARSGKVEKVWVSRDDDRVRSAHRVLDGQKQPIEQAFTVFGIPIRFPGDPLAPVSLSINCRCRLRFK